MVRCDLVARHGGNCHRDEAKGGLNGEPGERFMGDVEGVRGRNGTVIRLEFGIGLGF